MRAKFINMNNTQIKKLNITCLLGNATNNLWVLGLTLGLFNIRQAELQLIITFSTMRNNNNDNTTLITDFVSPHPELN
jgi:hypothetical protein